VNGLHAGIPVLCYETVGAENPRIAKGLFPGAEDMSGSAGDSGADWEPLWLGWACCRRRSFNYAESEHNLVAEWLHLPGQLPP
jgi:hypothetical protein